MGCQGSAINLGNETGSRSHRSLHAQGDVVDDMRLDRQLTVRKQFYQYGTEKRIVRLGDGQDRQGPEARAQIGQRGIDLARRAARSEEQEQATFAGQVQGVEQRALIGNAGVDILNNQGTTALEGANGGFTEGLGRHSRCSRSPAPDVRKVGFTAARRPDQDGGGQRPLRPAVDEIDCGGIRAADEEILRSECRAVSQIEDELARPDRHGRDPAAGGASPPVPR